MLGNLFSNTLKTNEYLYFTVLKGCSRLSKESILTGLNNLKTYTITDSRYDEYFGFEKTDIREMLQFYGLTDYVDEVREWYDGYSFGDVSVYFLWKVINYYNVLLASTNARLQNY